MPDWLLESAKDSEKDEDESPGLGDVKKSDSDAANIVEDALQLKLDEDLNEYRDVRTELPESKKGYSNRSIQEQDMEEELNHEVDDQEEEDGKGKMSYDSLLLFSTSTGIRSQIWRYL